MKRSNEKHRRRLAEAARDLATITTLAKWAWEARYHVFAAALWLFVQSTSYTTEARPSLQPQNVASTMFLGHHQAVSVR